MRYLLDTGLLSELVRPRRDAGVLAWLAATPEAALAISVVSLGEIAKGMHQVADEARRERIRAWMEGDLKLRFRERLLPVDLETAEAWGAICGEAARRGEPLPVMDAWIAAAARRHGLIVVTRNVGDLARCGAEVLDPWRGGA